MQRTILERLVHLHSTARLLLTLATHLHQLPATFTTSTLLPMALIQTTTVLSNIMSNHRFIPTTQCPIPMAHTPKGTLICLLTTTRRLLKNWLPSRVSTAACSRLFAECVETLPRATISACRAARRARASSGGASAPTPDMPAGAAGPALLRSIPGIGASIADYRNASLWACAKKVRKENSSLETCIDCVFFKIFTAVQEERTPQGAAANAKLQRASTPTPLGFSNLNFIPPAVPYFPQNFDSPTSPVPRMLSHAASRMYGSLPNLKMEFDRSPAPSPGMLTPQARAFTPPPLDSASSSTQISVSVLVNADMQAESQPEAIKKQANNIRLEDLFEGIKASLLKVIEWSKRIPAFGSLSLDDQVKLLKSSWCEHCTLKLAAQNGPKSDTVLLANGLTCNKDNIEDPEVRRVLFRIFSELAYWLDYLNVDRVELACLKGILLFNPGK